MTLALLAGASTLPVPAGAAAISFNTALPVAQRNFVWRQILFRREGGLDRPRADVAADGTTAVAGYGVTSRLALFADLSWFRDRSLNLRMPGRDPERDASGIGDLGLTARYTLWQWNRSGETVRIAPILQLEAPTGDSGGRDRFGPLPPLVTPGSGGWDATAGAIGTWQTLGHEFDVELAWRRNGSDDGLRFGEEFTVNASWQQRIFPRRLDRGTGAFTYAVLESRFSDAGKDERHGTNMAGTGGQRWLVGPGLQYVTRRWIAEVVVLLPAWQDVGERVPEDDFRVLAGWRVNF
ncbi:MAG: transporter [Wenzhouxiangellaceae bacterium]|nr:transporter [Wenzhouxiangellaceae bacterium]